MSDQTGIEWTDATWNPVTGCTKVSPGCDHCYAEKITERFHGKGSFAKVVLHPARLDKPLSWRKPRKVFVNSMSDLFHQDVPDEYIARVWSTMRMSPRHTFQILTKRHARMKAWLDRCAPWGGYITHNGNPSSSYGGDGVIVGVPELWPLPNVWLGVSVENQQWADIRIPALLDTPAAVRFLSCEPLLGPVDLFGRADHYGARSKLTYWLDGRPGWSAEGEPVGDSGLTLHSMETGPRIDWVIVGGESGHGARPMHPQWARTIRDQCEASAVPFLFKQWGEWGPAPWTVRVCDPVVGWKGTDAELAIAKADAEARGATHVYASWAHEYDHDLYEPPAKPWSVERVDPIDDHQAPMRRWGKSRAGRELDGRTWDQYPEPAGALAPT